MKGLPTTSNNNSLPTTGKNQRGAVLIISLVMLTILTIIAMGTMTDTNLQTNMAKNNQISLSAFNSALSELRAQHESSANQGVIDGINYVKKLGYIKQTGTTFPIAQGDLLTTSANNPFSQEASISFIGNGNCGGEMVDVPGFIFEINSASELVTGKGSGISSNQTFGICHPQ